MLSDVKELLLGVVTALLLLLWTGCSRPPSPSAERSTPTWQEYDVRGVVVELNPARSNLVVRHEEIPGYMRAMTMPFAVRDTNLLKDLSVGDTIRFRLRVTEDDGWIESVEKLPPATTNRLPLTGPFRVVRDVEPLQPGDSLPAYPLTNQWGRPISTTNFHGQVLVLSFLYTRCPFPTFCPRTMQLLVQAQRRLQRTPDPALRWHFLVVSFDPEFDTPEVLRAYGQSYGADTNHCTLATGALIEVTALAEQFGLGFWREDGGWAHNLRTAVVDPEGRLRRIFTGNEWTPDELARAVIEAHGSLRPPTDTAAVPRVEPH